MTTRVPATLRVLAWDHPRALRPLAACNRAWAERTGAPFAIEARSLHSFGDDVPADDGIDVVLIDHPHLGAAASAGSILPLDGLIDPSVMAALAADAVGGSHDSYAFDGRHWALAVDAACQALAVNDGALAGRQVPTTWADVVQLAGAMPGAVALPLRPAHAISAVLSLLAGRGEEAGGPTLASPGALQWALATLADLAAAGPAAAFEWEPPDVLARLEAGELACVPLSYTFVGYGVAWHDAPRATPRGDPGSILGGAGLSIMAGTRDAAAAAALITWLAARETQCELVGPAGGQPASRTAWEAPGADPLFRAVRATAAVARVRPRDPWWPDFQNDAGALVARGLQMGAEPAALSRQLDALYRERHEGR